MQTSRLFGRFWILSPRQCFLRRLANNQKDFYSVLGVKYDADQKDIKDNFYKLSKEFHPDLNKDNDAAGLRFKEIAEAYETLSNPDQRKEYDQKMGFGIRRQKVGRQPSRKFTGMKGQFVNGQFVDEEAPPQMRNIQYDLSPEKMEKVWARYKARWDRIDEIERVRELEKKKEEFRRRLDLKRAKMQNMTAAEKEDFLFKLRLLRTDAAEDVDDETLKQDNSYTSTTQSKEKEYDQENFKQSKHKDKRQERKEDLERQTREILMNQFGMSEENYKKMFEPEQLRTNRQQHHRQRRPTDTRYQHDDPLYHGLDSSRDAPDWKNLMRRTIKANKEKYENMRDARMDSVNNRSRKHGVDAKDEPMMGAVIVCGIMISACALAVSEYRHASRS